MPAKNEISYTTKEESKNLQEAQFLALRPADRFFFFIRNMAESRRLFKVNDEKKNNFILKR